MKITLSMLEKACEPQRALFAELFGQEVELTLELCIEHADQFNWYWAAGNLLPQKACAAFEKAYYSARAAFDKAIAPAQAAYNKARESAIAEYDKAIATASAGLDKALATALAAYSKALDSARAAYSKARATAFFNAATMEEK